MKLYFPLFQVNKTDRYFDGCIDNVVLNQESLNLWDPVKVEGNRSFCSRRYHFHSPSVCGRVGEISADQYQ